MMKKIIIVTICVAMAILAGTSCNKTCKCKTYVTGLNGKTIITETEFENENKDKKCSDYGTNIIKNNDGDIIGGTKCK